MGKAVGRLRLEVFRFFDVAGRHQSFAKVARELGVTPRDVAPRVRTLEQYLGEELFKRQSHGLAMSTRGQAFLVEGRGGPAGLARCVWRFRTKGRRIGCIAGQAGSRGARSLDAPPLGATRRMPAGGGRRSSECRAVVLRRELSPMRMGPPAFPGDVGGRPGACFPARSRPRRPISGRCPAPCDVLPCLTGSVRSPTAASDPHLSVSQKSTLRVAAE